MDDFIILAIGRQYMEQCLTTERLIQEVKRLNKLIEDSKGGTMEGASQPTNPS